MAVPYLHKGSFGVWIEYTAWKYLDAGGRTVMTVIRGIRLKAANLGEVNTLGIPQDG